ncbi:MAG: D-alanyl-D-alanine carboxypeptidase/D-alanyl-D-alanine-endopeptidase [Acidobacteria bacterium]|nr:D-alanyl-D-alanine carboxypeptidase/D-alanyl-D-alanine-endopeptidase [Acidobacteriota bacterium]
MLLVAVSANAQTLTPGQRVRIADWYGTAQNQAPGLWGVAIADAEGRILWSAQPELSLVPASTTKVFTTGFARSRVGSGARRVTRVIGAGRLEAGTGIWRGTWAVELNGDPTFERPARSGPTLRDLAKSLRGHGIRVVDGPLTVTSSHGAPSASYPAVWSTKHEGSLFAPPVGPLTLNENVVHFTIRPGAPGAPPVIVGSSPAGATEMVQIAATTVGGTANRLSLRPGFAGGWSLTGSIGSRSRVVGLSAVATNPSALLYHAWGSALRSAGITWRTIVPPERLTAGTPTQVLAEVVSAPFDTVALEVNRRSVNIGAELLLQWGDGTVRAAEELTNHVRLVVGPLAKVHLVDGSGLSNYNRISPLTQVLYLAKMPRTPAGRDFPLLLPANGMGTLRRLRGGLGPGVVHAKTGTLDDVSTLLGYLGRRDGMLIVSLMYNGPYPSRARQAQWKLFRMLGADGVDLASMPDESFGGPVESASEPARYFLHPAFRRF